MKTTQPTLFGRALVSGLSLAAFLKAITAGHAAAPLMEEAVHSIVLNSRA